MKPKVRQSLFVENPIPEEQMLNEEKQMTENFSLHLSLDTIDINSFTTASIQGNDDGYVIPISELDMNKKEDTKF